jgi:hypothetical protein
MRKSMWSKTAVAAFLLTLGVTTALKAVQEETIWVYSDNGDTTQSPQCSPSPNTCATLHEYFPDEPNPADRIGDPVMADGQPVTQQGNRLSN